MPAIRAENLTKRYGEVVAVDGLTLTVAAGEIFGFLGPNGAGKSTTIDMLLDFVRPTSGTLRVLGRDPEAAPRAVRERVGVLPQAYGYYDGATARQHVAFAAEMKRADADPDALLERVGVADAADRAVGGFSRGMRQRLGLAVALVGEPDLLVLDEPLSGLDPSGAALIRDVVREERARGATVFLSSHIMDQVDELCDRVGVLHDGSLLAADTVAGLRDRVDVPQTVTVDVDEVPADLDLGAVEGVTDVRAREGRLRVTCADPGATSAAVARLDAADATVERLDAGDAPLEDVFLRLTDSTGESAAGPGPAAGAGGPDAGVTGR